jgi:hypothetical protein
VKKIKMADMSISHNPELEAALGAVDQHFRQRIIKAYLHLRAAYASGEYDAAGLRAGVFSEAVVRLLQQELTGMHTPFGNNLHNFADICRDFEKADKTKGHESIRIIIPRCLLFIYTLRNKRGIGHIGGEIEANEIDAATMLRAADWCISEMIRIYHKLSIEEAQCILDAIALRQTSQIWSVGGKHRVLNPTLSYSDQTLLLLHSTNEYAVPIEELADWVEHPRLREYKANVVNQLHKKRVVEWDRGSDTVILSPTGIKYVEEHLLTSELKN